MNLNIVHLVGRLGKDPDVRTLESGNKVASFSLATSEHWKSKTGEKQERTEWHNIVVWGKTVDVVEKYLHKGDMAYIQGNIRTRSWEKDGKTNYITEIFCDRLQLFPRSTSAAPTAQAPPVGDEDEDNLPF